MSNTTDPALRSWVESANDPACDFPIQNLPYGVFTRAGESPDRKRIGVAIGDQVLDLAELESQSLLTIPPSAIRHPPSAIFDRPTLNAFLALGRPAWLTVREQISVLLRSDNPTLRDNPDLRRRCLASMSDVTMHLPVEVGDYTDFYSSKQHATNVGSMFRDPKNALLPNWKHIPVGYHGRSSSIVLSGTDIHRPWGQTNPNDEPTPTFGPCRLLDFELEVGFITGPGNPLGRPIPVEAAREHIFGMVLVNDWSARDIQKWEYIPLGPFTAKNFATSISAWVVPIEALEPFRVRTPREPDDPPAQNYLDGAWDWNFDMAVEVLLQSAQMKEQGLPARAIARTNFRHMYWNMCQQLAHQTITGCNIRPGDLYASGTVSGPENQSQRAGPSPAPAEPQSSPSSPTRTPTPDPRPPISPFGSLLEICWKGTRPLTLPTGEERKFLADGDTVILQAHCGGTDRPRIGFGEARATILPTVPM